MEERAPRRHLKRSLSEDEDSDKPPAQKRVRFPKGKKVKSEDEVASVDRAEECSSDLSDPWLAAKERAKRRNQMTAELFIQEGGGILNDISAAEVNYEDNANFVDDGIQIEPFNLNKEREEGYFDAAGNFVEYVNENEVKDAWMDSIDVESRFAEKNSVKTYSEEDSSELSPEDIGRMKRRIANLLEPEETVLQALRRLKGNSNNKKEKMPAETKLLFDQLTEDAMKLMENGEYNVYHEKQEVFEREAEGYERMARAKEGTSTSLGSGNSDSTVEKNMPSNGIIGAKSGNSVSIPGMGILSNGVDPGVTYSLLPDTTSGPSYPSVSTGQISSSNDGDAFDMFGEEDENASLDPSSQLSMLGSGSASEPVPQVSSVDQSLGSEGGDLQTDYVYDESSGYYYSSSLGYYYDPTSGLYCCASSGRWYSFNEQTGSYDELQYASSM